MELHQLIVDLEEKDCRDKPATKTGHIVVDVYEAASAVMSSFENCRSLQRLRRGSYYSKSQASDILLLSTMST